MPDRVYEFTQVEEDMPDYINLMANVYQMSGMMFQGEGKNLILFFPPITVDEEIVSFEFLADEWTVDSPTDEEWSTIVARSDNPLYYDNLRKIWLRKFQRAISGNVQQKVWARDNFMCMYCHREMGQVQLTVDHFIPLELSGTNDMRNYISACRRCNKDKGRIHPKQWLRNKGQSYEQFVNYLMDVNT